MRLGSVRDLAGQQPVLMNPDADGPNPVYWVFTQADLSEQWANLTMISPGRYGKEYPKTYGHYHSNEINETYKLFLGDGVLQLQKKKIKEGVWIQDEVEEVLLVRVKPGEEVLITPEYGHSWSNVGNTPLVSLDNWTAGHQPGDYAIMEKLRGLSYYLIEENGQIKAIPNPNYKNLPGPVWLSVQELSQRR